jgi:hypothetical protein
MDALMFQEVPKDKRGTLLKDNCDAVVEKGYMKQLTPEQISESKEMLSETAIQINDIEVERKEAAKEFKTQLGPLFTQRNDLLKSIKEKAVFVKEECFKFVNTEDNTVGFYNSDGFLIEQRPAFADELQGTIFQISRKTGTNDK